MAFGAFLMHFGDLFSHNFGRILEDVGGGFWSGFEAFFMHFGGFLMHFGRLTTIGDPCVHAGVLSEYRGVVLTWNLFRIFSIRPPGRRQPGWVACLREEVSTQPKTKIDKEIIHKRQPTKNVLSMKLWPQKNTGEASELCISLESELRTYPSLQMSLRIHSTETVTSGLFSFLVWHDACYSIDPPFVLYWLWSDWRFIHLHILKTWNRHVETLPAEEHRRSFWTVYLARKQAANFFLRLRMVIVSIQQNCVRASFGPLSCSSCEHRPIRWSLITMPVSQLFPWFGTWGLVSSSDLPQSSHRGHTENRTGNHTQTSKTVLFCLPNLFRHRLAMAKTCEGHKKQASSDPEASTTSGVRGGSGAPRDAFLPVQHCQKQKLPWLPWSNQSNCAGPLWLAFKVAWLDSVSTWWHNQSFQASLSWMRSRVHSPASSAVCWWGEKVQPHTFSGQYSADVRVPSLDLKLPQCWYCLNWLDPARFS